MTRIFLGNLLTGNGEQEDYFTYRQSLNSYIELSLNSEKTDCDTTGCGMWVTFHGIFSAYAIAL